MILVAVRGSHKAELERLMFDKCIESEEITFEFRSIGEWSKLSSQLYGRSMRILEVELDSHKIVLLGFCCHIVNLYF
jgi:hypothetical protein